MNDNNSLTSGDLMSLVNRQLLVTREKGVISFVRKKKEDHAFLIIERQGEDGQYIAEEAHLTWKYIRDVKGKCIIENNKPKRNYKKADIMYFKMKSDRLMELEKQGKSDLYIAKSFLLDEKEYKKLVEKILSDQKSDIDYQTFGNKHTLFGGSIGDSLDLVGAQDSKDESIENNDKQARKKPSLALSIDSTLRRGHSCISWAIETMKYVKPEFSESILSKLLVVVPSRELPENFSTSCLVL